MPDDRLGMHAPISRRDFLNGTLLAGAGLVLGFPPHPPPAPPPPPPPPPPRHPPPHPPHGQAPAVSPADAWNGYGGAGDYARAHGNMYDVMTTAHRMRDGEFERAIAGATGTGEMYDLVAVGGGISGLAAAVVFQRK